MCVALYHFHAFSHIEFAAFLRSAYLFVDFFFVLSGFVISHTYGARLNSPRAIADFTIRRFGRLWPLHAATLAFMVLVELLKLCLAQRGLVHFNTPPFDPASYNNWPAVLTNLLLIQAFGLQSSLTWNGSAWSICTEFWTYLVFAALCWSGGRRLVVGAAAAIVVGFTVVAIAAGDMNVGYDYGFFRCIFGFFTGYFVYRLWRAFGSRPWRWVGALELPALVAVILFVIFAGHNFGSLAAPLMFGAVVLVFAREQGPVSRLMAARPVALLGAWSYSIYMVHVPLSELIIDLVMALQRFLHLRLRADFPGAEAPLFTLADSPWLGDLMAAGYVALVLAVAAMTYRFIENPGRDFFNHLAWRRRRMQPLQPAE